MSFTSQALLASSLDEEEIQILVGSGTPFTEALQSADAMITRCTGVETPADPAETDRELVAKANALVIWTLTGRQNEISEQEMERRRKNYDDAVAWLEKVANGEITYPAPEVEDEPTEPQFGVDTPRVSNW